MDLPQGETGHEEEQKESSAGDRVEQVEFDQASRGPVQRPVQNTDPRNNRPKNQTEKQKDHKCDDNGRVRRRDRVPEAVAERQDPHAPQRLPRPQDLPKCKGH